MIVAVEVGTRDVVEEKFSSRDTVDCRTVHAIVLRSPGAHENYIGNEAHSEGAPSAVTCLFCGKSWCACCTSIIKMQDVKKAVL